MAKCLVCGKEVSGKESVKLTIDEKTHYFCGAACLSNYHPIRRLTRRVLSSVVLNKTFAELIAIGTGISGIAYTLQGVAYRALIMDTFSAIAAIAAFVVGVEHLRYLREHNLLGKTVFFVAFAIMITIALAVWHFAFSLN